MSPDNLLGRKDQRTFGFMTSIGQLEEPYPDCQCTAELIRPPVPQTEMTIHGKQVSLESLTMEKLGERRIVSPSEVRVTGIRNATAYEQALAEKRLAVGWGVTISCGCSGVVVRVDGEIMYLMQHRCLDHGGRKRVSLSQEEWA